PQPYHAGAVRAQRHAHADLVLPSRHHVGDHSVQSDRRQFALPEGVTHHRARRAASWAVVLRREGASYPGLHSQYAEEIAADVLAFGIPRLTTRRQVESGRAPGNGGGEWLLQ